MTPVPGYAVLEELARGGMAAVYRARDLKHDRIVALKLILPDVAGDPEFTDRFRHEVAIHSKLDHPNILKLFDVAAGPERWYIAMEFVDGGSLQQLREHVGRLPPEIALFATRELLRGLAAAHAKGVIHRDVKPHNVLVTRGGDVKVADFGISRTSQMTRLTQTGNVVGTPAYMSPEQALARPLDARTDVFSAGVILYELMAGGNPFLTDNPATTLRRILDVEPEPLSELDPAIPVGVERLIERLIAKDRLRRPASAQDAATACDAALAALGETDPAATFRTFLGGTRAFVAARAARLHGESLARALELVARGGSDEAALWEAVLAARHDPVDAKGRELLEALKRKTGYRVERNDPGPKLREALAASAAEPDEPALLLRAAKAAKIDRDFLRMMRLFFRLSSIDLDDAYLKTQVASLVARPAARGAIETAPTTRLPRAEDPVIATPRRPAASGPAVPAVVTAPVPARLLAGAALAVLLVLLGLFRLLVE